MGLFKRSTQLTDAQTAGILRELWRADLHELNEKHDSAELCRQSAAWKRSFAEGKARFAPDSEARADLDFQYTQWRNYWRDIRSFGFNASEEARVRSDLIEPTDEELLRDLSGK